ncbi:MAG TPA: hypothetical protein VH599_07765 [Ktedonobacterales bacterium]|jgi:hypothetical protein
MASQEQIKDFNPNDHLLRIQGKDYLPVRWRLVWFHQATDSRAGYVTVELDHDRQNGFAKFFTIAWDGKDETWRHVNIRGVELDVCGRVATGEGSETRADFNDYYEKAATKALGRALAGLSFGTQFAPELDEKQRIVDSPVERPTRGPSSGPGRAGTGETARTPAKATAAPEASMGEQAEADGEPPANEQQLISIRKLCAALGREEPAPNVLTFTGAGALIRQLSREYNNARRAS